MIVRLDEERGSMVQIGNMRFTFLDPGPKEVDLYQLDKPRLNQLLYNLRKGVLRTNDKEEMRELLELTDQLPASRRLYSTPEEVPIDNNTPPKFEVDKAFLKIEEEERQIKKLLRGKVEVIQKDLVDLTSSQLRKLVDLEVLGKARASVIKFAEDLIVKEQLRVQQVVGTTPMNAAQNQEDLTRGLKRVNLDNLTDVVESDTEQVVLNPYSED